MAQEAVRTALQTDLTSTRTSAEISTSDIAILAYQLWEERGRPDGSSEQDWFEAERQLRDQLASAETA